MKIPEQLIPKYFHLAVTLKKEIAQRKIASGAKFYSQRELMDKHRLSYATVTRALEELVREGVLTRAQGKGTFIAERETPQNRGFKNIGLYLPHLRTVLSSERAPSHYSIIHQVSNIAEERGYTTTILGKHRTCLTLDKLRNSFVDGLLVVGGSSQVPAYNSLVSELRKSAFPYVLMDRNIMVRDINYVEQYSEDEIHRATMSLVEKGHRRIAGIGAKSNMLIYQLPYFGFRKALEEENLYDEALVRSVSFRVREQEMKAVVDGLLDRRDPPTAVFVFSTRTVPCFLAALKSMGVRVPEDISLLVIGPEQVVHEGLAIDTFGGLKSEEFGSVAANALLDLIEGRIAPPVNINLELRMLCGHSVRVLERAGEEVLV